MQEYFSEAIVLDREPVRDLDDRFSLFTKKFGKLVAKAKSSRKITSKLSGHLEPGSLVLVRFIEKGGLQLVDALKFSRTTHSPADLYRLHMLLAESEPDQRMWQLVISKQFDWIRALKLLGWDPNGAACALCDATPAHAFHIPSQEFFCANCSSKSFKNELIYIEHARDESAGKASRTTE